MKERLKISSKKKRLHDINPYMSPAKNLGGGRGRGLRKILGGGVKKFHEILQADLWKYRGGLVKKIPKVPLYDILTKTKNSGWVRRNVSILSFFTCTQSWNASNNAPKK
jgi:hypothetical protein